MGIRYCMYCGMAIPPQSKFCPECGKTLESPEPPITPEVFDPWFSSEKPKPKRKTQSPKQASKKSAALLVTGLIAVFCTVAFFFLDVGEEIKNARSRHQEYLMDEQRQASPFPKITIPEISMPEISIPDIQLPKPAAAALSVESYKVETTLTGETILYVNINYTNKEEEKKCFLTSFKISVQQDGETCRLTAGDQTRENHLTERVEPEETALISEAFLISPEKETTVSVAAFFGEGNCLEETILPHADGTVSVSE